MIAKFELQEVTLQNMNLALRWDDKVQPPSFPERAPSLAINGHLYIQDRAGSEFNLPLRYDLQLQEANVKELYDIWLERLLPIATQIVTSKDQPWRLLFGGAILLNMIIINWAKRERYASKTTRWPFGFSVMYCRYAKSGELLPDYRDWAMWERDESDNSQMRETHRGLVPVAQAEEFTASMQRAWDALTAYVIAKETKRLGLGGQEGVNENTGLR